MKQNYFHKRKNVATLATNIKSGMSTFRAQVHHMEESEAEKLLSWYEKNAKDAWFYYYRDKKEQG